MVPRHLQISLSLAVAALPNYSPVAAHLAYDETQKFWNAVSHSAHAGQIVGLLSKNSSPSMLHESPPIVSAAPLGPAIHRQIGTVLGTSPLLPLHLHLTLKACTAH